MLLAWGKTCPCSSCGETGSSLLQTPPLQCPAWKEAGSLCLVCCQPCQRNMIRSPVCFPFRKNRPFPPSYADTLCLLHVRHGQAAGRCDCHSLSPLMSQPTLRPAGCRIRSACRYLFIKLFAVVATFSQLCCPIPMSDPSFHSGKHQMLLLLQPAAGVFSP